VEQNVLSGHDFSRAASNVLKTQALATEGVRIEQNRPSAPKGEMFYGVFGTAKAVPFQNCFDCRALFFSQGVDSCNLLSYQMSYLQNSTFGVKPKG